ncbi:MAG: potassium/proton antiporter [Propionibacteriales bacterium]|nr:potassium/proton antiporter [Propionibacteriales bacterium]
MTVEQLDGYLLAGAAVLLAAILAVRVSFRIGLPSLLLYLVLGLAIGESGLGVEFDDPALAHALGFAALVVILAEGGVTTRWSGVRGSIALGSALATIGVGVSSAVVAVVTHYALGLDWELAVLIGAVSSPTDSAAVFSVLRRVPVTQRLSGVLEAESGLNDASAVLLVTLVSTGQVTEHAPPVVAAIIAGELVGGALIGVVVGFVGAWVLRRAALPASGLYPLAVLAFSVVAYAGAAQLHASGFAAVYIAALVLGNSDLPHRLATRSFAEGTAWLAQIGLFVMLGLLASPERIDWWHVLAGLLAGAVLTVVARPLSVVVITGPLRLPWREQTFIGWAGLRGAVPIVLATIPLAEEVRQADDLFDLIFVMVFVYTLLQAPTLPWVATRLGVTTRGGLRDLDVEAAPLDRLSADLLQVWIPPGSHLHGVELRELRLPEGTSVALIVRGGQSFVPELTDALRVGDDVLVVTPRQVRDDTERRLRAVGRGGRLAGWLGQRPEDSG